MIAESNPVPASAKTERRAPVLQIGPLKLVGPAALVVAFVLLLAIGWLLWWFRGPLGGWPMGVSLAMWIVFIVYWSAAAKTAAPTKSSESVESRRVHVRLMNGAYLLLFLPVVWLRGRYLPDAPVLVPVGLLVQAASGGLAVWARRHLGRNWSGAITVAVDHRLVRSGPYRVVRHPIYSAMLGMFAGTAIVSGEWHALAAVVLIAIAYARKIRLEEASLRSAFGAEYDEYRRASWALVPGVF